MEAAASEGAGGELTAEICLDGDDGGGAGGGGGRPAGTVDPLLKAFLAACMAIDWTTFPEGEGAAEGGGGGGVYLAGGGRGAETG